MDAGSFAVNVKLVDKPLDGTVGLKNDLVAKPLDETVALKNDLSPTYAMVAIFTVEQSTQKTQESTITDQNKRRSRKVIHNVTGNANQINNRLSLPDNGI